MMSSLTPERLNELEQLARAATPGPWTLDHNDTFVNAEACDDPKCGWGHPAWIVECPDNLQDFERDQFAANMRFIAATREAVPALLSEVRALRESVAREFVFSCPTCGDPGAVTVEPSVDVHSGATYRCASCQAEVIFTAQTPEQYCAPAAPLVSPPGDVEPEKFQTGTILVPGERTPPTLAELARQQGVDPNFDIRTLAGTVFDEDDDIDEFLAASRAAEAPAETRGGKEPCK